MLQNCTEKKLKLNSKWIFMNLVCGSQWRREKCVTKINSSRVGWQASGGELVLVLRVDFFILVLVNFSTSLEFVATLQSNLAAFGSKVASSRSPRCSSIDDDRLLIRKWPEADIYRLRKSEPPLCKKTTMQGRKLIPNYPQWSVTLDQFSLIARSLDTADHWTTSTFLLSFAILHDSFSDLVLRNDFAISFFALFFDFLRQILRIFPGILSNSLQRPINNVKTHRNQLK